jgi:hypothetical protein
MSPESETPLLSSEEPEKDLEGTADELEERVDRLGDHIDDAKQGLRARREDADEDPGLDDLDDEEIDPDEDPLAFDDPEADDLDSEDD